MALGPVWIWIVLPVVFVLVWQIHSLGFGLDYWRTRDTQRRKAIRAAARIRRTWPRTARKLRLYEFDPQAHSRRKGGGQAPVRIPPIVATTIRPGEILLEFDVSTVIGIDKSDFEQRAGKLINAWRTSRVDVWQADPGRIQIRLPHGSAAKPTGTARPASDLGR
ncbi:hypothetical protein [Nocardia sp. NPDC127526]|uniref:hypothetical protein n=1 Tax=Nocardia sp. NPDC127526 TaxID=3345393 RepID=UPI0036376C95